jgi:hypothetical protein
MATPWAMQSAAARWGNKYKYKYSNIQNIY